MVVPGVVLGSVDRIRSDFLLRLDLDRSSIGVVALVVASGVVDIVSGVVVVVLELGVDVLGLGVDILGLGVVVPGAVVVPPGGVLCPGDVAT